MHEVTTNERRNEIRRARYADMTAEQKSALLESYGLTKEKLAERARTRRALRTPEQRKEDSEKARNRYRGIYINETQEDRAKRRESNARFCALHPERRKEIKRKSRLKYTYGLTPEQYEELFRSQEHSCACCKSKSPGSKRGWHIDHCHATGMVRGILCHPCNLMIGNARDNEQILLDAVSYLAKHRKAEFRKEE